jgi:hypothetical protein
VCVCERESFVMSFCLGFLMCGYFVMCVFLRIL